MGSFEHSTQELSPTEEISSVVEMKRAHIPLLEVQRLPCDPTPAVLQDVHMSLHRSRSYPPRSEVGYRRRLHRPRLPMLLVRRYRRHCRHPLRNCLVFCPYRRRALQVRPTLRHHQRIPGGHF